MTLLHEAARKGRLVENSRPWPRRVVDQSAWLTVIHELGRRQGGLVSLWSDGVEIHMALLAPDSSEIAIVSLAAHDGRFPSVARVHAPASRLERAISDLYGLAPEGSPDKRRWLDHGRWGLRHPGGAAEPLNSTQDSYEFLKAEGAPLHQIPVGPIHAGVIEPGHFRFSANGEIVVRLEERLGYAHKGVAQLMVDAPLDRAARLAGRVSGDSTVAYALAFSQAVESALGVDAPRRAILLRALMAELERLANHIGDIGAICNDVSFAMMHAQCGILREHLLRTAKACFGHRLMMDCVAPGGVCVDLDRVGMGAIRALVGRIGVLLPRLIALFGDTTSLQDRTVGTGILDSDLARQYGCGGVIGRASGRDFDARRAIGYAPYGELSFELGASSEGDVDARVWVRFDEIKASLVIVEQILDRLPAGPLRAEISSPDGVVREGAALVESFRGDIFAWVRIGAEGRVERCHLRDPSWFQWPLLEAAIKGNIVADFPVCNKSFNCSYSGHDL